MIDYVKAIRDESERFLRVVDGSAWDRPVPSCPGWDVADLTWHLTQVQHTWGEIAGRLLIDRGGVPDLERPANASLVELFGRTSTKLVDALANADPAAECWSWHPSGRTVGWVQRRQAHEALIHRIDAELAAGDPTISVDAALAADGVDEVLTLFMDASDIPDWSSFTPDGRVVDLRLLPEGRAWTVQLGRFEGTSPSSGTTYDDEAVLLVEGAPASTTVEGGAAELDRWLWGRGSLDDLRVSGDEAAAAWIRAAALHATQ